MIINTPDVDISKGVIETPQNVIALEQIVAQGCSAEGIARGGSNLIVSGKGGVPPLPTAPISSDNIYIEGESVNSQTEASSREKISGRYNRQGKRREAGHCHFSRK
ncbi:MAG: hypothetical protein QNJ41_22240 [Xenococcaceae cyanobacterium MO_188.B32]|nr:hypothetical protein [Xenococcaceae cyanobacterium MO_188.B32]